MFTSGLALLTWSTIYGLENFDVWDGSELSCIAVANIAAGKVSPVSLGQSDAGDHIRMSDIRLCSLLMHVSYAAK